MDDKFQLPSAETTHIVDRAGLRVSPLTVLAVERVRERHDPSPGRLGVMDVTETATHCMVATSVNSRVPF